MCINSFRLQPETGLITRLCSAFAESISGPAANIYWPPLIYGRARAPHSMPQNLWQLEKLLLQIAHEFEAREEWGERGRGFLHAVTKERNMCAKHTDCD